MDSALSCSAGKNDRALSVDAARLRALAATLPISRTETCQIDQAVHRVLAKEVLAPTALPPFDNSAMDGFCFHSSDLDAEGPWSMQISGTIAAGETASHPKTNGAARIFTGAPVPRWADTVIQHELVQQADNYLTILQKPMVGKNIRRVGEDCESNALVLQRGQVLSPPRLALLAATGCTQVEVFRRLRVAILSTGDELVEPGTKLRHGQIYNSNRTFLRAALTRPWIEVSDLGIVGDDLADIRSALRVNAGLHDVIISSGGMSAGGKDHLLDALIAEEADLDVLKVAIRPGKPLTVGRLGKCLFFGLPGNPLAAAVTFSQIAVPALRKAAGMMETPDFWIPGVADFSYRRTPGRREFIPVNWSSRDEMGRVVVQRLGSGSSAGLVPLSMAMGLAIIEPDQTLVLPGEALRVEPLFDL